MRRRRVVLARRNLLRLLLLSLLLELHRPIGGAVPPGAAPPAVSGPHPSVSRLRDSSVPRRRVRLVSWSFGPMSVKARCLRGPGVEGASATGDRRPQISPVEEKGVSSSSSSTLPSSCCMNSCSVAAEPRSIKAYARTALS